MPTTEYVPVIKSERLAAVINDYWKYPVARVYEPGNLLHTTMKYGVPLAAFTTPYTHPCIVRVRRFGRVWNIVE
jgi:hypothetical protein